MALLQNPCSVCGLAILSGDSFIGTGDGQMTNGGSFAHDVCYYRDQAKHLQKLCEEQSKRLNEYRGQELLMTQLEQRVEEQKGELSKLMAENKMLASRPTVDRRKS